MEIFFEVKKQQCTLNRPSALNALNLSMAEQFANKLQNGKSQNIEEYCFRVKVSISVREVMLKVFICQVHLLN